MACSRVMRPIPDSAGNFAGSGRFPQAGLILDVAEADRRQGRERIARVAQRDLDHRGSLLCLLLLPPL